MAHQTDQLAALKRAILAQAVEEALEEAAGEGQPCSGALASTGELAAALAAVREAGGEPPAAEAAECSTSGRAQRLQQDWLAGRAGSLLGVQPAELAAQLPGGASAQVRALHPTCSSMPPVPWLTLAPRLPLRVQAAVRQLMPHIERALAERCRQLAAAVNYESERPPACARLVASLGRASCSRPALKAPLQA